MPALLLCLSSKRKLFCPLFYVLRTIFGFNRANMLFFTCKKRSIFLPNKGDYLWQGNIKILLTN